MNINENASKTFNKRGFIEYLQKNGVTNGMIERIERLPDILHINEYDYNFNIITTWRNKGRTHHEFEMNYYCDSNMEFLLSYKIFRDIEISLNFLECELLKRGFVDAETECDL